jgi:hypothetical protein
VSSSTSCRAWLLALFLGTHGCGNTSEPVIERVAPREPPKFTHRVDVFLVTSVESCAIGTPCAEADAERCFFVGSGSERVYFDPAGLDFAPVGDPRVASAQQSACFQLDLDEGDQENAERTFRELRSAIFRLSDGNVDLDVRLHLVAPDRSDFKSWDGGGIFLQPTALGGSGLSLLSRDSDFTFAVTGEASSLGPIPKISPCGGSNSQFMGGLGGASYTWLSASCLRASTVQWHFLSQAFFAMRDVVGLDTPNANAYPGCGQAAPDPKLWFPRPTDCSVDPDASTCGNPSCDPEAFPTHIFEAHWPTAAALIGNHCRNGRQDYDETAADEGGVCDALGR